MAKNIQAPPELQIASIEEKRRKAAGIYRNLMEPGTGTPWEDRGSLGVVVAFFKTAIQSCFKPVELLHAIRRPETSGDSTGFLIGCGIMWGLSVVVHQFILLQWKWEPFVAANSDWEIDHGIYWLGTAFQFLACPVALYLGIKLLGGFFNKMVVMDMKGKAPPVLTYNVFAYCLGPSIFSVIPFIGPLIAGLWIFLLFNVAGTKRLYIKTSAVVIATIVSTLGVLALGVGAYFVLNFIWYKLPTGGAIQNTAIDSEYHY